MTPFSDSPGASEGDLGIFTSPVVDAVRAAGNVWKLPGGEICLPRVFGFCRGVKRALAMLDAAVTQRRLQGKRLFLLGEIIHNPWVNEYFARRGVQMLSDAERSEVQKLLGPEDCAVIPAFGVPLPIERELRNIGCEIIDTTCGDVRRLWAWTEKSVREGYGVLIFGRARHDETVVTKSRLSAEGGKFIVAGDLEQVTAFCDMIRGRSGGAALRAAFDDQSTNADSLEPFERLAQVSQTTMLYDETMQVRKLIREAFGERFGPAEAENRLLLEPTVCRATQDRQAAAVELCQGGCDLVVVVGGFGSSNTRHLHELASTYCPAYFIEDVRAIHSAGELHTMDIARNGSDVVQGWLPEKRPLRVGVLAGASSPEVVVGEVMQRIAEFLE